MQRILEDFESDDEAELEVECTHPQQVFCTTRVLESTIMLCCVGNAQFLGVRYSYSSASTQFYTTDGNDSTVAAYRIVRGEDLKI